MVTQGKKEKEVGWKTSDSYTNMSFCLYEWQVWKKWWKNNNRINKELIQKCTKGFLFLVLDFRLYSHMQILNFMHTLFNVCTNIYHKTWINKNMKIHKIDISWKLTFTRGKICIIDIVSFDMWTHMSFQTWLLWKWRITVFTRIWFLSSVCSYMSH